MNAKQIKTQKEPKGNSELTLIPPEKAPRSSVWDRIRKAFSSSDLTLESWELLEMKRTHSSFNPNQWSNL